MDTFFCPISVLIRGGFHSVDDVFVVHYKLHKCFMLYTMYGIPYHLNVQGFICPICMEALRSAEALQVHWEAAHSSDRGGGGANAVSTKLKPSQYNTTLCYMLHVHIT